MSKTMIDRTLGGAQKAGLENKELYLIATAADGKKWIGSLAIFKETLHCWKHTRWVKTSVDIEHYEK